MNSRVLLAIALSMLFIFVYQIYFTPPPAPIKKIEKNSAKNVQETKQEYNLINSSDSAATAVSKESALKIEENFSELASDSIEKKINFEEVNIETKIAYYRIQNLNGTIKSIKLKDYFYCDKKINRELIEDTESASIYPLKLLFGYDKKNLFEDDYYEIVKKNSNELVLRTTKVMQDNNKLEIVKKINFKDEYLYDFQITLINHSDKEIKLDSFKIAQNTPDEISGSFGLMWFPGIKNDNPKDRILPDVLYSSDKSVSKLTDAGTSKIKSFFSEEDKLKFNFAEIKAGSPDWISAGTPFFANILIPVNETKFKGMQGMKSQYSAGYMAIMPEVKLSPKSEINLKFKIYSGPKKYDILKKIMPELKLENAIDFGWTRSIAIFLLKILNYFYKIIPDYGIAIILLTLLVNIALYPLKHKSAVSMEETKKIQPQINALKEKYKKDKKKFQEELMALYRQHKINPMGGCLPLLIQIPIFFGLYNMLAYAIELRAAPMHLTWLTDLSQADQYHILPILFGLTTIFQQKMTPMPNPEQQKIMIWIMPVFLTFLFWSFSSGLVLYFLVNNIIGIIQQFFIHRRLNKRAAVVQS